MWNEKTFAKLQESPPERLLSSFQVTHSMLLNVLSQKKDGCKAMKDLIRNSHESDAMKIRHRKRAFQLFRALTEKSIIEFIPKDQREETKIRVNVDLQEDFSLNQALSLYLLDTLNHLDPAKEDYALRILTLCESIVENPTLILRRQLDRIKREELSRLKSEGLDYEDRLAALEQLDYPKPHKEWIYGTFNEYASRHPWIGQENIMPKSIAREMFETYQSFSEYIKEYSLERVEGLLLRYLSGVYKVLVQTVPYELKNDMVDDIAAYLETIIKTTDSSLVDEWEKLKNPPRTGAQPETVRDDPEDAAADITVNEKTFMILIRNAVFHFLRALSTGQYERCLSLTIHQKTTKNSWTEGCLETIMEGYYKEHERILLDPGARSPVYTRTMHTREGVLRVLQTITDPDQSNDWEVIFDIDLIASRNAGAPVMTLVEIGEISPVS